MTAPPPKRIHDQNTGRLKRPPPLGRQVSRADRECQTAIIEGTRRAFDCSHDSPSKPDASAGSKSAKPAHATAGLRRRGPFECGVERGAEWRHPQAAEQDDGLQADAISATAGHGGYKPPHTL